MCDEQERKAIDMHLKRMNIKGNVEKTEYRGIYRVRYTMKETPLISIVIPNKDHVEDLKKCIDSLEKKSSYDNREYIIVENNSTEEQTFAYYNWKQNVQEPKWFIGKKKVLIIRKSITMECSMQKESIFYS